jgi:hypothetical protein
MRICYGSKLNFTIFMAGILPYSLALSSCAKSTSLTRKADFSDNTCLTSLSVMCTFELLDDIIAGWVH